MTLASTMSPIKAGTADAGKWLNNVTSGNRVMKRPLILCVAFAIAFVVTLTADSSNPALARGGGGHHSGGAFGTASTMPGTNSLGTALSSGGANGAMKGPALGTGDPAVDREDARVAKTVKSICRGC
jgi:uncharacterized membrane protein